MCMFTLLTLILYRGTSLFCKPFSFTTPIWVSSYSLWPFSLLASNSMHLAFLKVNSSSNSSFAASTASCAMGDCSLVSWETELKTSEWSCGWFSSALFHSYATSTSFSGKPTCKWFSSFSWLALECRLKIERFCHGHGVVFTVLEVAIGLFTGILFFKKSPANEWTFNLIT